MLWKYYEFGFSVAHLAHQNIFGSFLAEKKWSVADGMNQQILKISFR